MIRARLQLERAFDNGQGTLDLLFNFSGTSGFLGDGLRLPSNWIADWRRLYDVREAGRPTQGAAGEVQPRDADRHAARQPAGQAAARLLRRQPRRTATAIRQPRVPQPHAGEDGQARDGPGDGRAAAAAKGVAVTPLTEGADPRRLRRRRLGGLGRGSATAFLRGHAAVVLRPARGRAQRRPAHRRRRPDRRGDLPPRDRGQPDLDPARHGFKPRSARTTRRSTCATSCSSPSRARRRCSRRSRDAGGRPQGGTMTRLVQFPLESGGVAVVQVADGMDDIGDLEVAGDRPVTRGMRDNPCRRRAGPADLRAGGGPGAAGNRGTDLPVPDDDPAAGRDLGELLVWQPTAEAGAVITAAGASANFSISMTWRAPPRPEPPGGAG